MSSPLVGVSAMNAIGFGVYGNVKRRFAEPESVKSQAVAAVTSGFAQVREREREREREASQLVYNNNG